MRQSTRASERGTTVLEFTLLTPLLILVVFAVIQFSMYFFARHIAIAAAQAGARVARTEAQPDPANWRADAEAKAASYVRQLGPKLLEGVTIRSTPAGPPADVVGVRVSGQVPKILPFIPNISVTSEGPIERFVEDQG